MRNLTDSVLLVQWTILVANLQKCSQYLCSRQNIVTITQLLKMRVQIQVKSNVLNILLNFCNYLLCQV